MENEELVTKYPIQLCIGDSVSYSCRVIHTEEEEEFYRGRGLIELEDLPDPEEPEEEEDQ